MSQQRDDHPGLSKSEAFERSEDQPSNPTTNPTIGDVVNARFGRRRVLKGMLGVAAIGAIAARRFAIGGRPAAASEGMAKFGFQEIAHGVDETHHVAPGYTADILIRWGDPVVAGAPDFDPMKQTAAAQAMQFGYNNDFVGFTPLPPGVSNAGRALLCVNHEYTDEEVMFPGLGQQDPKEVNFAGMTRELVDVEIAATGASIVEIDKSAAGKWSVVRGSRFGRRVTSATPMRISGPAAGHDRMKTSADPAGVRVLGTVNNCAGGMTPWGTYLTAEENFNGYFWGSEAGKPQEASYKRYGVPGKWYAWGKFDGRWDIDKEPNEPNRFGWIVEIDPYDPTSTPVKRTALGRFKHEGAETVVNGDGRVVLYSGDDERFDYAYRFVSEGRFDPANREANRDLLDRGTLSVARFDADGSIEWLPLVFGSGPLTPANGFRDQGDLLIDARRASDLLGATKMDRPEDVEPNPVTNKVYLVLTNNSRRTASTTDAANPRADNNWGHLIEMVPPSGNHAADKFAWNILVKCGDPADAKIGAAWNAQTTKNGWFACPDNAATDPQGRLWISTDQGEAWSKASGTADGIYAVETEGAGRGTSRMFFRVPVGAEMCGPRFTPDGRALFAAVQHVAVDGAKDYTPFGKASTFESPATRWPDFKPGMPPRPSVVVITKNDGGIIGA